MKPLLTGLIGVVVVAGALIFWVRAKANYDALKKLEAPRYAVVPITETIEALLAEIEGEWTPTSDSTENPETEALTALHLVPSVSTFLAVANGELPPYKWFSTEANRHAIDYAMVRNVILPRSIEKWWYVAESGHVAFIRCNPNLAFVYRDEPNGLRVKRYVRKPNKAPEPTPGSVTPRAIEGVSK
jgi:hypothetical protein